MICVMMAIGAPVQPLASKRGFVAAIVELTHVHGAADVGNILGVALHQDGLTQQWSSSNQTVAEADARRAVQLAGKLLHINTLDFLLMTGYTVTTCGLAVMLAMLAAVPVARAPAEETPQLRAVAACKAVTSDRLLMASLLGIVVAVILDGMETIIGSTLLQRFAVPAVARGWATTAAVSLTRSAGLSAPAIPSNSTHLAGVALIEAPGCMQWPEACRALSGRMSLASPSAGLLSWQFVAGHARSLAFAAAWGSLGVRLLAAAAMARSAKASKTASRVKQCCWGVELASVALRWATGLVFVLGASMLAAAGGIPVIVEAGLPAPQRDEWRSVGRAAEVLAEGGMVLSSLGMLGAALAALWVTWLAWKALDDKTEGPSLADAV